MNRIARSAYYLVKPILPRRFQIFLRSKEIALKRKKFEHCWPILPGSESCPENWCGWPEGKQFALILTHDVDTFRGQERCYHLMQLETDLGFRSVFNFVPERYKVSAELRADLLKNGFEVGVHGLNHDGKLFQSKKIFDQRSPKINHYLKAWSAVGFRSPAMHHNLEWIHDLNIKYDMSTFDVDPFEPQSDGVHTIFPFWVTHHSKMNGYVELPYTLPQDFTLFILMKERNIDIWKEKLNWISKKGGMALLNTHPDYMNFDGKKLSIEEYPVEHYQRFLEYVKSKFQNHYWHGLPSEIAAHISKNSLK
jgi:hypothetical protein